MSDVPQMGPGVPNPFGFDFTQIMRMLQSPGPVNFEIARQVASAIATGDPAIGQPSAGASGATPSSEPSVDPATAAAFDDLVRATQTAVADTTGIASVLSVASRSENREGWAIATLDGLAPVLEALAGALGRTTPDAAPNAATPEESAGEEALFGFLMQSLMPVLLGVWSGWMIGQLSHHALGQYDLPLPLDGTPRLLFVTRNVDEFADAWSLPADELRYAVTLRETVHGAQRSVPWVRERCLRLAREYVGAYELNTDALEQHLGDVDFTDPEAMQSLGAVTDAGALLGSMRSERQTPMLEELQRFVSVLEGYTDSVVDTIGGRMISSHVRIDEALRRHRLERGDAAAFVDRLLGLELDRNHYEEGLAFCRGVVERAGLDGLNRLWQDESMVPTRPEFEAPGLWLARIEL